MNGPPLAHLESEHPTNVRFGVLGFGLTMSVLLYVDRFAYSVVQSTLMDELHYDETQAGLISGVFFVVYALAQVPSGWLSDRYGGRLTLTIYVFVWSLSIGAMGFATGLFSLMACRILLGLAQAGAYPCIAGVLKNWVPIRNRGVSNSFTSMGGRLGILIANLVTPQLMLLVGLVLGWTTGQWRLVFVFYGLLGLCWSCLYWLWFRDTPSEHPQCNAAEIREILPAGSTTQVVHRAEWPPFAAILSSPTMLCMCMINFWVNVGWIFLATWLNTYLVKVHHQELANAGQLALIPHAASMLGGMLGGFATDRFVKRMGLVWGRRITGVVASGGAAIAYFVGLQSEHLTVQIASFAVVGFMIDFGLGSLWAVYQDIAGRHVASVLGFANMCGNLAGGFFAYFIGAFAKNSQWDVVFGWSIAALLIAMTCWLFVNPSKPLVKEESGA